MGPRFPGTLSARIIAGFVVVIVTVAIIASLSVLRLNRLDQEISIIRGAYLQLALRSLDLAERQAALLDYLKSDLVMEVSAERVRNRLRQFTASRNRVLDDMERILGEASVPDSHVETLDAAAAELREIRELAERAVEFYKTVERHPPIQIASVPSSKDAKGREQGEKALLGIKRIESSINNVTRKLENTQRHLVVRTAAGLQEGSQYLRTLSVTFGAGAVGVGLLVVALVAFSLRPLQRLRVGAQNIAKGDYASRIDERGPTDVAELAREFNLMRRAVEERERELIRSERLAAVGKMAATIAHEVRNPLSSIGLNTELLEDELQILPEERIEEARSLCQSITKEVDRLTEVTGGYLAMARVPQTNKRKGSVNQAISSLAEFERPQLETRKVELELALDGDLPSIEFDENQLRQALLNLVRNAADAAESVGGGKVSVKTKRAEKGIVISVSDRGPGVPKASRAQLFDAFYSTKDGGTGLGLALTHRIIREHGGEVSCADNAGPGARFDVFLPFST